MTALTVSAFTYFATTVISVAVSGVVWAMGKLFSRFSRNPEHTATADAAAAHSNTEIAAAISAALLASRNQETVRAR